MPDAATEHVSKTRTRTEMLAILSRGETITYRGKKINSINDVPDEATLAQTAENNRQVMQEDLEAQQDALARRIARLKAANPRLPGIAAEPEPAATTPAASAPPAPRPRVRIRNRGKVGRPPKNPAPAPAPTPAPERETPDPAA